MPRRRRKRTSRRRCLGVRCGPGEIGRLNWQGPTKRAKVVIGAKPGDLPCWDDKAHRRRCDRLGKRGATVDTIDDYVLKARNAQIGRKNVGLTRYSTRGYYQGKGERSFVYDIIDTGSDGSAAKFERNMRAIAEGLSKRFCQDEVLVEYTTARGTTKTKSYTTSSCRVPKKG